MVYVALRDEDMDGERLNEVRTEGQPLTTAINDTRNGVNTLSSFDSHGVKYVVSLQGACVRLVLFLLNALDVKPNLKTRKAKETYMIVTAV